MSTAKTWVEEDGRPKHLLQELEETVPQIIQAFKDDGWLRTVDVSMPAFTPYNQEPRMTGQEWYERFEKELEDMPIPDALDYKIAVQKPYTQAAKRASGIEENQT